MTDHVGARPKDQALVSDGAATHLHPSGFDPSREAFDKKGVPFALGDVVKVFHFVGARKKRHYMYKQVVGERVWPSGYCCWVFSHLNMKPPEDRDGGFYVARDGATLEGYEIVQCCSKYPAHFSTRLASAIATEARRAETSGSVHEGADPKGIADV